MRNIIIAGFLILSNSCFACPKPVITLQLGQQAPCKGFLFSPEKEQELRLLKEDHKILELKEETYLDLLTTHKENEKYLTTINDKERKKAKLWRTTAEEVTLKYVNIEDGRGTRDIVFLGSGVLLTVLAAWSMGQISK